MVVSDVKNPEQNLKELLHYYSLAPGGIRNSGNKLDVTTFYTGQLLGFAKTSVRSYSIGITETASPQLREVLKKQLNNAIQLHGKVFYFLLERGLYPSYDLSKLLNNDISMANKAISL